MGSNLDRTSRALMQDQDLESVFKAGSDLRGGRGLSYINQVQLWQRLLFGTLIALLDFKCWLGSETCAV